MSTTLQIFSSLQPAALAKAVERLGAVEMLVGVDGFGFGLEGHPGTIVANGYSDEDLRGYSSLLLLDCAAPLSPGENASLRLQAVARALFDKLKAAGNARLQLSQYCDPIAAYDPARSAA